MDEYIYRRIFSLKAPIGEFTITNKGIPIVFSVLKNPYNQPYGASEDDDSGITTDTNYVLQIDVDSLEVGETYKVAFSLPLDYCDSDEHTEALCISKNGWSVGLGMLDPNDEVKMDQYIFISHEENNQRYFFLQEPPCFDRSNFVNYDVERSEDKTGYSFTLLDRSAEKISFLAAWIENNEYSVDDCEAALGFWLT